MTKMKTKMMKKMLNNKIMKRDMTAIAILMIIFAVTPFICEAAGTKPGNDGDIKHVLKIVSPSVVKVVAENHKVYYGSGIAIEPDYVISTTMLNRSRVQNLYIKTVKGETFPAKVVGKDPSASLLLLKLDKKVLKPIKTSGTPDVGDWIALVGVFYNKFPAIFQGIVSSASDENLLLNAPVAPGSSGGAVVNDNGELVGMIRGRFGFTANPDYIFKDISSEISIKSTRARSRDLCMAVPAPRVTSIVDDLKKFGRIRRGWLGVTIDFDLFDRNKAVVITDVVKDSPAQKAGLRKGDALLKIKDMSIDSPKSVSQIVKSLKPGQKTKIEIKRGQTRKSMMAVIGELGERKYKYIYSHSPHIKVEAIPELHKSIPDVEKYVFTMSGSRILGIDAVALTPELAKKFKVSEGGGLMISKVFDNTAAAKAGILPADIIITANETPIKQNTDLRNVLNRLKDNTPVALNIYRGGKKMKINVVPDKGKETFINVFDRLKDKLEDIYIRYDDEGERGNRDIDMIKRREFEEKRNTRRQELRETELIRKMETEKQMEMYKKEKELDEYKKAILKMKREQELLRKEMQEMREMFRRQQEEKKKQKEKEDKEKKSETIGNK